MQQSDRQSAAAVGRPKKLHSQLLSEASRLVRDKSTRVTHAANDLQKTVDALKTEIGHVYPSVPQDLQRVQVSSGKCESRHGCSVGDQEEFG